MIGKLIEKVMKYFQARLDVLKLTIVERIAVVMGFFLLMVLSMMLTLAFLVFLGMGLGEYLGEVTGHIYQGYLIVAGIYLLVLGLIMMFKRNVKRWFAGLFISLLTTDDDDDDDKKA